MCQEHCARRHFTLTQSLVFYTSKRAGAYPSRMACPGPALCCPGTGLESDITARSGLSSALPHHVPFLHSGIPSPCTSYTPLHWLTLVSACLPAPVSMEAGCSLCQSEHVNVLAQPMHKEVQMCCMACLLFSQVVVQGLTLTHGPVRISP